MSEYRDQLGTWDAGSDAPVRALLSPSPMFYALRSGTRNEDGTVTQDNGDGTGTRTTFDADGTVDTVEQLTGLPVVVVPLPTDPLLDATDPRDTTKLRRT